MEKPERVCGQNDTTYEVFATEGLLTFCQRLAEMEAGTGLAVTFDDSVIHQMAEVLEKQRDEHQGSTCTDKHDL